MNGGLECSALSDAVSAGIQLSLTWVVLAVMCWAGLATLRGLLRDREERAVREEARAREWVLNTYSRRAVVPFPEEDDLF